MNEDLPSRSAVKRQFERSKDLVREMILLNAEQIRSLPMESSLVDAVIGAKNLKKGALTRQIRYANGLLANEDVEAIAEAVAVLKQPHQKEVANFHRVERWRERILKGDVELIEALINDYQLDRNRLRQLMRNAKSPSDKVRKKAQRELFRYLSKTPA